MKKMDNNGFSLIELIIVIAIMAVLVALILPNLTKYLGKSKVETDRSNRKEIEKQVKNVIAETAVDGVPPISLSSADKEAKYVIKGGDVGLIDDGVSDFADALSNVFENDMNTKSKQYAEKDAVIIIIKGDDSDGYTVSTEFAKPDGYAGATWLP